MSDKKLDQSSQDNGNELLERDLISQLIDFCHGDNSLRSLSETALRLVLMHPLLTHIRVALWHYDFSRIYTLASSDLTFDSARELKNIIASLDYQYFLQVKTTSRHGTVLNNITLRTDIYLEKTEQHLFGMSFWLNSAELELARLMPFFKVFLGILNLGLLKIVGKNRDKLLKTILEGAGDSVEITDDKAVIQYVNPSFEKITLYKAAEAINKTVSSLLRSSQQDTLVFEEIRDRLDRGITWRGQIRSRKKDGTPWIAQTTIVPVMDAELGRVTQHIALKQDITEQVEQFNQLKLSEERYRNLMNAAADAIFIHDLKGVFIETNEAACKSLGYTRDEICSLYVWDIEVGASPDALNQMWQELQNGPISLEGKHRRKDGSIFPVEVRLGILNSIGEKLVIAIVRDISVRKQFEDTIRKLTRALEQSPVLVMITDKTGLIEYVNAKVLEQTGYLPEEILGQNTRILQSGKTPVEVYEFMWEQLIKGEEWRGELLNKNKSGEYFWVSAIISSLRNDNDETTNYLAVMEDVSQKKSYEEMLRHQATYDNLTNLPNRLYGYNKLEHALAKIYGTGKKLAVLFIDLDEFKQINDSLGHAAGDILLKALSERYLSIIRQTDTIARLGGDEFMMILEHLSHSADAERIAKKCQEVCLDPFVIESQQILVSSSIGIAIYPDHGRDAKTLMRNADTAMYQSKSRGKNNWTVFVDTMAEVASNRIRIKSELHQGLDRNELYICYQPIIDLKANKIIAAEALLRWESANLGYVMPDQIIPIAEETGLIIPLGYWILKKVCAQIKAWQLIAGKQMKIAVNISTLQLKQKDFVTKVKAILKKAGVQPESLIFEITESAFIDDSKFILSQLNQLHEMNIHCSLDDFGVGYSSLNYIRTYPFKSLKIDRVFIQGITNNTNDLSLVNSIIAMSRNLKLIVVAEGIETAGQLELIRSMNCDFVQGWYFSKALDSDKFLSYLNDFKIS